MPDGENLDTQSVPTPEELKQEEQALAETKEDEVKSKVIEELGLDETVDSELIDKITSERLQHKKELSTAIRQKIKAREALKSAKPKPEAEPAKPASPGASPDDINKIVDERLNERDLKSLDLSDELKQEIKVYVKVQKELGRDISYSDALKSPYISSLKAEEEKKMKIERASISPKQKANTAARTFSKDTKASDFDMATPEGRADFKEYQRQNP